MSPQKRGITSTCLPSSKVTGPKFSVSQKSLNPPTMANMASFLSFPTLSLIFLLFFASSAAARPGLPFHPCKTLLISTYSVSFNSDHQSRPEFVAVVAELRGFRPELFPDNPQFQPRHPRGLIRAGEDETLIRRPDFALGSSSSLRDRTLDVLNVLASLLFGAACGALTAGTMYIVWCLFTSRFENYQSLDDFSDDEDDDDDFFYPSKLRNEGCVAVPAAPSPSDSTET